MSMVGYNMLDEVTNKLKEPMSEIREARRLIEDKEKELTEILTPVFTSCIRLSYHSHDSLNDFVLFQFNAENKKDIYDSYFVPIRKLIDYLQTHSERPINAKRMLNELNISKWEHI